MNAEILSVGTELLLGHTVNTDTAIVARELSTIGVNVLYCATVGDNPGRLKEAVETALSRSDILVTTGGLGPTGDDLTKETVAQVCARRLTEDAGSLSRIEEYFRERGLISMTKSGDQLQLCLNPTQGKVDLWECPYLSRLRDEGCE